jgi:hypothetical protein
MRISAQKPNALLGPGQRLGIDVQDSCGLNCFLQVKSTKNQLF